MKKEIIIYLAFLTVLASACKNAQQKPVQGTSQKQVIEDEPKTPKHTIINYKFTPTKIWQVVYVDGLDTSFVGEGSHLAVISKRFYATLYLIDQHKNIYQMNFDVSQPVKMYGNVDSKSDIVDKNWIRTDEPDENPELISTKKVFKDLFDTKKQDLLVESKLDLDCDWSEYFNSCSISKIGESKPILTKGFRLKDLSPDQIPK